MKNLKKALALATAATLVFGNAITVFATEPVEGQVAEGSINGEGESEGHVEKKKTYVTLPTTPAVSPFAYTMDPEGLIAVTGAAKYGDTVAYPAAADDTRVYFNNGEIKEGANQGKTGFSGTSNELKVINNSSHDISLTITAEAVSADTDIPLVAKDEIDTAEAASLYLGLIVDTEEAVAIKKAEAATKTLTVAGSPDNFKIAVKADKSGYEYRTLTLEEYKDLDAANASATELPWAAKAFKLEGAATEGKSITSDTTAPEVKVTWSWVDPSATPAISMTAAGLVTISNASCTSSEIKSAVATSGTESYSLIGNDSTFSDPSAGTITLQLGSSWLSNWSGRDDVKVTITLADDTVLVSNAVTFN